MTDTFDPYITTNRRLLWVRERYTRTTLRRDGPADCLRAQRLAQPGTPFSRLRSLPGTSILTTAGVLAVEEVLGAGIPELLSYGLPRSTAEALQTSLEGIAATMVTFQSGSPLARQTYDQDEVSLLASVTKTASYTTDSYEVGDRGTLRLLLDVTAVSGTLPRMHVQIETRKTSSDSWRVADAFLAIHAVGSERRTIGGLDRLVQAVCTLEGTNPSFTFSLVGEAV